MGQEESKSLVANDTYTVMTYRGPELPEKFHNMVLSKWMRQLRQGNDYFALIESGRYYKNYNVYIKHLLSMPETLVRIATLPDQDTALGFSVASGRTLHFVFVSPESRKNGIGRSLMPKTVEVITHLTKMALTLWSTKLPAAIFDPFQTKDAHES